MIDQDKLVRLAAVRNFIALPPATIPSGYVNALRTVMKEYQLSLLANADHPNTQMAFAGLALSFKNIPASKAAIEEALSLDPQLSDAWIMMARLNTALKRPDLVQKNMTDALQKLPNSPTILHFFGNYLTSQRQFDTAKTYLEKAIELSKGDRVIRSDYAAALSQMGQYDQAIVILSQLVEEKKEVGVLFLLANAQLRSNDRVAARKSVLKLLSIDPSFQVTDDLKALFSKD